MQNLNKLFNNIFLQIESGSFLSVCHLDNKFVVVNFLNQCFEFNESEIHKVAKAVYYGADAENKNNTTKILLDGELLYTANSVNALKRITVALEKLKNSSLFNVERTVKIESEEVGLFIEKKINRYGKHRYNLEIYALESGEVVNTLEHNTANDATFKDVFSHFTHALNNQFNDRQAVMLYKTIKDDTKGLDFVVRNFFDIQQLLKLALNI